MKGTKGKVAAVNGNMVAVQFDGPVMMNEVAFVETEGKKLKSEVIRIKGDTCSLQVFEMTKGVTIGDNVEFSGDMLAIELGPDSLPRFLTASRTPFPSWRKSAATSLNGGYIWNPFLPTRNGHLPQWPK